MTDRERVWRMALVFRTKVIQAGTGLSRNAVGDFMRDPWYSSRGTVDRIDKWIRETAKGMI